VYFSYFPVCSHYQFAFCSSDKGMGHDLENWHRRREKNNDREGYFCGKKILWVFFVFFFFFFDMGLNSEPHAW
jgi:hypothetical protein